MHAILPLTVGDTHLLGSSIAEPDAGETAWVASASYTLGDERIRTQTHRVYRCIEAHNNVATPPEDDAAHWLDIGPTNRWAPFDTQAGTRARAQQSIVYTLAPGIVTALGLAGLDGAQSVSVEASLGGSPVFSFQRGLLAPTTNWMDWLFSPARWITDLMVTGLPPFHDAEIGVTVTGPGEVGLGALVAGRLAAIGGTRFGPRLGIADFSRVEFDPDFGTPTLVRRGWAKEHRFEAWLPSTELDGVYADLVALRATPTFWAPALSRYPAMALFGVFTDFEIAVPGPRLSYCSLTLRGLT